LEKLQERTELTEWVVIHELVLVGTKSGFFTGKKKECITDILGYR
jgi:hypothetical protein